MERPFPHAKNPSVILHHAMLFLWAWTEPHHERESHILNGSWKSCAECRRIAAAQKAYALLGDLRDTFGKAVA